MKIPVEVNNIILNNYDGFIFDLDGTIYRGQKLLPGAEQVIAEIKNQSKSHVFLSNKPIARRDNYAEKLTRLGIDTTVTEVINSSWVTADYLQQNYPAEPVYVIGEISLMEEIAEAGVKVVNKSRDDFAGRIVAGDVSMAEFLHFQQENYEYEDIACLVISFDRTFHYGRLNDALQIIKARDDIEIIATNPDNTCPIAGGEVPDAASMITAVEAAGGRKIDKIMGKPSEHIIKTAIAAMGFDRQDQSHNFLMLGDRLQTDIKMGIRAGIDTALVLSGVTGRKTLEDSDLSPNYVLDSVGELLK